MTVALIKPHYVRCKSLPNNYGAMQVTGKTVKVHELLNEVKILTAKIFISIETQWCLAKCRLTTKGKIG